MATLTYKTGSQPNVIPSSLLLGKRKGVNLNLSATAYNIWQGTNVRPIATTFLDQWTKTMLCILGRVCVQF